MLLMMRRSMPMEWRTAAITARRVARTTFESSLTTICSVGGDHPTLDDEAASAEACRYTWSISQTPSGTLGLLWPPRSRTGSTCTRATRIREARLSQSWST